MKSKFLLVSAWILLIIASGRINAQTAQGGCTSVTVTSQLFDSKLIESCYIVTTISPCEKFITNPIIWGNAEIWLQRRNPNGTYSDVYSTAVRSRAPVSGGAPTFGEVVFPNLAHGTYRGRVRVPVQYQASCGPVRYHYAPSLNVGTQSVRSGDFFTAPVVVGATVQSDIAWTLVDATAGGLYASNEIVRMNTTGTKNYDSWWLAIFEQGGQNRYWSQGWTQGQVPTTLNLTSLTSGAFGTNGLPFATLPVSYSVQFAISAGCNTQWTNLDKIFQVCPSGLACRVGEEEVDLQVAPNPANSTFQLLNLEMGGDHEYQIMLTDMTGRIVKSYEDVSQQEFDISDLSNGLYIVNVWDAGYRLLSTKLSVVK